MGEHDIGSNEDKWKIDQVDTCFLPDQYAIQWAWNGSGYLQSYDPRTRQWTDHGQTVDPDTGNVVGGFALAFKNDAINSVIYFQRSGRLYQASPDDPIGTFKFVGQTLPDAPSSYPCFAFDPSGRLLAGIGTGSTVIEIDPDTGAATNIGPLIDDRDGAALQAGPGDWYFDPNGDWYMMARDTRGATFGESTGTVLWKIDPSTLNAVRVSDSESPSSGTGAEWLSASTALLSTSGTNLYQYNTLTDEWSLFEDPAIRSINDLSAQWIIPDPVRVIGCIETNLRTGECVPKLKIIEMDENNEASAREFDITLPGKFGPCAPEPNPFVTDPFSPTDSDSGCDRCSDDQWHVGCSDAGETLWRIAYDAAGNASTSYLYGTLTEPVSAMPAGFRATRCDAVVVTAETIAYCDLDVNKTIYRKELSDGSAIWFDESGEIAEPANFEIGECPNLDPLLPVTEQIICLDGETYIRVVKERYEEDAVDGLPVLAGIQIVYYNADGVLWDSGEFGADDPVPAGEPTGWYLGDCVQPFVDYENRTLCEKDAEFLLLIDSGGAFARYSLFTKTWETVNTLSVPSAGASADYDNFLLYAFVAPDQLVTVDVNTDTQLPNITITDGIINPGVTANPKTFSAASFNPQDGFLYAWDTGGSDAGLYRINVTTGVIDFVTTISGVSGTGTSMAIDPDGRVILAGSNLSYEIDLATGVGTVWNDPPIRPNGSTFDANGNYYVTEGNNTYVLPAGSDGNDPDQWSRIIDDWGPGANSIAYYRTVAPEPKCFIRRIGIYQDGSTEIIGDFNVADNSPRTIVGDVDCCGCNDCSGGGTTTIDLPPVDQIWNSRAAQRTGTANFAGNASGNVRSYTITVTRGTASVTLESGDTLLLGVGSRTWEADQDDFLDGLPDIAGTSASSVWDIIWEER